jgi:AcrR family transcriptional regulator
MRSGTAPDADAGRADDRAGSPSPNERDASEPCDDRTTKARIRDAAVERFAREGVAAASLRAIAADAGVSAALVIHHFGSKDGLRTACDHHVATVIRQRKREAASMDAGFDPLTAIREASTGPPLTLYLARTLADGSPHVDALLDELVADAVAYQAEMEEAGVLRPTKYPHGRAAVLTLWSLGAVVLHEHLKRLVGVDLAARPADPAGLAAYVGPVLEILGQGVLTEKTARRYEEAFLDGLGSGGATGANRPEGCPEKVRP